MRRGLSMALGRWASVAMIAGLLTTASARADDRDRGAVYPEHTIAAPAQAVEITAAAGYTQGFGQIQRGAANNINDVANAGAGFALGLGWRATPMMSYGITGEYQEFTTGKTLDSGSRARGAAFDVNAQLHFAPYKRLDPWVKIGTGYRMLWQVPSGSGPTVMYHGFDFAKLQLGLDVRGGPMVAVGPMIGADLNVFFWRRPEGGSNETIGDPRINTFVYAGLQGRFDAGGVAVPGPQYLAKGF